MDYGSPSLGSVQNSWSLMRRVVPVDLAVPIAGGVVLLAAVMVSNQQVCLACILASVINFFSLTFPCHLSSPVF